MIYNFPNYHKYKDLDQLMKKGGNSMHPIDDICYTCIHSKPSCKGCIYNKGIKQGSSYIVGPCGQQLCWYGCDMCRKNNYFNYKAEENKEIIIITEGE